MEDDIRPGRLLVATPMLEDPNFRRSVVLVVDHGPEEGTVGVVLNRPTEVAVSRILPPWARLAEGNGVAGLDVVFQGGPVALDSALALAHVPGTGEPLGWRPLEGIPAVARVGLVDLDSPPALLADCAAEFRVFAGYAGWARDQLRAEIEEDAWLVVSGQTADVFSTEPKELWRSVLRRQGGELAFLATFPDDPALN
ncbi:YqgE/AlgH family protein [Actinocorallia sp. A-T 12471]|uniref:YqgE/AlgH family protein n=1 Tax=Actinocorallia sp. A-T 12471 TaxID=3089813 RepID=UPI0029CD8A94|nr:YqgE/AlgH family protein [Actinocorallia sp. A-T 12471]MDX6743700.1 YqgE/AlgH family protein [Actinocorallia sp. A-T 12471]